ncbi:putative porin [Kangiella shandongensis]|uniref:putative porin n=1 Tax=Kangiella shandongensis TaxID=2763258 RepID=UPI001CBABC82|nr:putative porin [Kangiella shandongensis]
MKLKLITAAVLLSSTVSVSAEEYQWFSDLELSNTDVNGQSIDSVSLSGTYFFDKKQALGPYNEFEYINKVSNVSAGYTNVETGEYYLANVEGELFVNNVLLGLGFSDDKFDNNPTQFSLGYLFNDDFLVRVDATDPEEGDTVYEISAAYNHQINDTDYLGFTLSTDDDTDVVSLSSKYFTHLGGENYFTADFTYIDTDLDNFWKLGGSYYFSKATSVFASVADNDLYEIGAKHFFNENVALYGSFTSQDEDGIDAETYTVGLSAQF